MQTNSKKKLFAELFKGHAPTSIIDASVNTANLTPVDNASIDANMNTNQNASQSTSVNISTLASKNTNDNVSKLASENVSINARDNISLNETASNNVSELDVVLNDYRQISGKKPMFSDIYEQQNIYIDRNLVEAVAQLLKEERRTKKDVYNAALKLYFQLVLKRPIKLRAEEDM